MASENCNGVNDLSHAYYCCFHVSVDEFIVEGSPERFKTYRNNFSVQTILGWPKLNVCILWKTEFPERVQCVVYGI